MEELAKHGTYVAGFLDPSVQGKTDLYDLFVNGKLTNVYITAGKTMELGHRLPTQRVCVCLSSQCLLPP